MRRPSTWRRSARSRPRRRLPKASRPRSSPRSIEGRLRKSLNEFALTGQLFVKDGDLTIEKLLEEQQGERRRLRALRSRRRHRKEAGRLRRMRSWRRPKPGQRRTARPTRRQPSTSRYENPASRGVFFMAKCATRRGLEWGIEQMTAPYKRILRQASGRGAAGHDRVRHRSGGPASASPAKCSRSSRAACRWPASSAAATSSAALAWPRAGMDRATGRSHGHAGHA